MTQTDPTPEILTAELLASGPFARANAPFRLLWVRGPDAAGFLHRLCSQDVLGLGIGEAKPAAFLDSKGKLLVTCLVGRLPDGFVLEVATAQAERLAALLERYHFTEKLTIAPAAAGCGERIAAAAVDGASIASDVVGGVVLRWARRGIGHERRHGGAAAEVGGEGAPLAEQVAECLRLLAGIVRVGVDTEPSTLALEADLDDHVSTTKGCYTGQEIVARIHTYGHVNRRLCLLVLGPGPAVEAPAPLHDEDGIAVGRVMRAVAWPLAGRELRLGVGFLPQDFQAAGTVLQLADGAQVVVLR